MDNDFLRQASAAGLTQIALGKLAAGHAGSSDVKSFGERMVTDHTAINVDMAKLAGSKGKQLATSSDPDQQQIISKLGEMTGADFDRAYSDTVVKMDKNAQGIYELEATHGEDADIREFARKTMSTLKEHDSLAGSLPLF
ncbi:putative membrane protein [Luteibacter sp. Sphag1AF]|uniref:DUF4142 domain-containing protein n=1 Tax=Luteibacter sp. Sphag1AF TaxID=2587031 RepID=UPI0016079EA3|nr:putative membrane protein [Luteibacter sp. Sphag1AF]